MGCLVKPAAIYLSDEGLVGRTRDCLVPSLVTPGIVWYLHWSDQGLFGAFTGSRTLKVNHMEYLDEGCGGRKESLLQREHRTLGIL